MAHGTRGTQADSVRAAPDNMGLTLAAFGSSVNEAIDFIIQSLSNHNNILIAAGLR